MRKHIPNTEITNTKSRIRSMGGKRNSNNKITANIMQITSNNFARIYMCRVNTQSKHANVRIFVLYYSKWTAKMWTLDNLMRLLHIEQTIAAKFSRQNEIYIRRCMADPFEIGLTFWLYHAELLSDFFGHLLAAHHLSHEFTVHRVSHILHTTYDI